MTIQDQYIETFRQTQETWADVVKSFTVDTPWTFGQPSPLFSYIDPNKTIDQVFDFWEKSLEAQRTVAKQLVGATISAGDTFREQVESVSAVVRQNVDSVGEALREQADSVTSTLQSAASAVRDEAAKTYDDLTKAELQEELGARGLPKSGNVDELRERLVADDLK
jgi:gas vesicle protein